MADFAKIIKDLRTGWRPDGSKAESITQDQLGVAVFVTRQAVSNWERGLNIPELQILILLSRFFGVDLVGFVAHSDNDTYALSPWKEEEHREDVEAAVLAEGNTGERLVRAATEPRITSFPPGIIDKYDLMMMAPDPGNTNSNLKPVFPLIEDFRFLEAKKLYGDRAVEITWPNEDDDGRYGCVMRYNYRMHQCGKYGYGEDFWEHELPFMIGKFPDTIYELQEDVFVRLIDSYMAAKEREYAIRAERDPLPYTLGLIVGELRDIKANGDDEGWRKIGMHKYAPSYYKNWVAGKKFGEYHAVTGMEEFHGLNTMLRQTFTTTAYGYNEYMPLRLLEQKEVTVQEPKEQGRRRKLLRFPFEAGNVVNDLFVRLSPTGRALLAWADGAGI